MKLIRLVTVILLASTLLISCSKDNTGTKNYFKVGGTEYALSTVYMRRLGLNNSGKNYITNLVLLTGDMKRNSVGWYKGRGNIVNFIMHTTTDQVIDSRVFVFKKNSETGTFYGEYILDVDILNDTHGDHSRYTDGTVSVSKDGLYYTVIIDCVDQKGQKVKGFYKGAIFYGE